MLEYLGLAGGAAGGGFSGAGDSVAHVLPYFGGGVLAVVFVWFAFLRR